MIHCQTPAQPPPLPPLTSPEYGTLWALLERRLLTPEQSRAILSHMIHETLFGLVGAASGIFCVSAQFCPQPPADDPQNQRIW